MSAVERVLWIDAAAGASGDMILGALVDLGAPLREVKRAVASLPLDGVKLSERRVTRGAVAAAKIDVTVKNERGRGHVHDHDHDDHHVHDHGRDWKTIRRVISGGKVVAPVRDRALVIFRRLFEAEAKAHGMSPDRVHLHEAGAADAIADIVGVATALHALAPDRIVVSPVTTGSGTVQCAHGLYPVPGPATAILLEGVPLSGIGADGERLTPTGAAILTSIAHAWGGLPAMTLRAIGHGAGSRDFPERPNVVRAILGDRPAAVEPIDTGVPEILVVEFTLDDATPQLLAYAIERLRKAGALDVHVAPVQMKKGRAGHLVTILARPDRFDAITRSALAETTTLGLRYRREGRVELDRGVERVSTRYGPIRVKTGRLDGTELHAWPEYEDCAAAARKHKVGLLAVQQAALAARKPRRR
ncbi:MAG TPA: nickel pincer cofactor biosynthesis protein LarC [Candidatus Polarisedimenticolaceae bacterium]|nr:nickel pincer cofactor biosynthesis protein LarC [Candidatus Polarisedimenticolaceae bacterium]